jgi:hypothetical protein
MRENPDLKSQLMQAIDNLPFPMQAKNQMGMGPSFVSQVRRLRGLGLSDRNIAPFVGVTTMTVHHTRKANGIL